MASFYAAPTSGPSPLSVTFDGLTSYDPNGTIVSYSWNFGDGETAAGEVVTHIYTATGTFRASLTVTDDEGNSGSAFEDILVGESTDPPVADFRFAPSTGIFQTAKPGTWGFSWIPQMIRREEVVIPSAKMLIAAPETIWLPRIVTLIMACSNAMRLPASMAMSTPIHAFPVK